MARKKKDQESAQTEATVATPTDAPVVDSIPVEPKSEPEPKIAAEPKAEEPEVEKKGRRGKTEPDKFDAWMEAAKGKWEGSIDTVDNLSPSGPGLISTGNFVLDRIMYGGLRRGRAFRYWGRPKSAKTGSALNCAEYFTSNHCADCFEHHLHCKCKNSSFNYAKMMYIDVEGRIYDNRPWIEAHGIHPKRIVMVAPKGGEQVVDVADAALRSNVGIGLIIVDSIAQMTSADEVLKPAEKGKTIGRNAMLINSALRKWICSIVSKGVSATNKPTLILINQIRNKTDSMGSPDVMPGGLGQEFASACDIKFTKRQKHYLIPNDKGGYEDKVVKFGDGGFTPEEDDTADFVEIECKVTESGICPAGRYGTFNYWQRPGHGRRAGDVDNALWLWEYAKKYEVMQKLDKGGYRLEGLEARTQKELETQFKDDIKIQHAVWSKLLDILNKK